MGIGGTPDTLLTVDGNKNFDTDAVLARFYCEKAETSAGRAAGIKFLAKRDGTVVNRYASIDAFRGTASPVAAELKINPSGGAVAVGGLATFSNGIAFSGQTDASGTGITSGATTLNHYEEGTWTPVAKDGSGGTTLTTSLALGTYVRVGKIVYVTSESPATIPHL